MKNKYIKLFMLIISVFILSGCVSVEHASIDSIIDYVIQDKKNISNHVNRGFKYYIPRGLSVTYKTDYNEIIKSKNYDYYLYVDLISYYNKKELNFQESDGYYYSKTFDDNKGIINITKLESRYLIVINYNYARIEVLVKEKDINMAVSNAIIICSSMSYNDSTIKAIFDEGVLSTNEKIVSVFKTNDQQNRSLLEIDDEDFAYEPNKDRDYIK